MNRLRHLWIRTRFASLAIIAMVLGVSLNAPMPAQAAIMDCGAQQVTSLSVGTYTAQEIANNPTLYNDLPGAINKAVEILKTCGNTSKEAVVTITTSAKNLEMPNQIGDRDYGLLILQGQDGAQPIMGKPDQRVVNKTRLTMSNLSFDIQSDYFNPEVFFNAHKCTVFGHGGSETFLNATSTSPLATMIGLRRNTFNDVVMAKGRFSKPNVEIEHNTATHSGHNPPPFIDLWPDFDAKSKVNIEKNTFTYNGNYRDGQMIRIARSNILVDGNTFITDNPKQGVGIELIAVDTAGVAGPQKLEDIDIRMNTFKLRRSISNGQLDGPDPSFIGRIIFHYNDLSFSPETLPKRDTYMDHTHTTGPCNYWGDLAKREDVKANRASMNRILTAPPTTFGAGCNDPDTPSPPVPNPSPPVPNPTPTPTPPPTDDPTPSGDGDDRFDGRTRFETSVEISQSQYPNGAKGVIVARSDDPADSVSAVPFAKLMGMPILLTQPDQLHPATATEIKRLIPTGGPVYVMGREVAIQPKVEEAIKAIGGKTERIAGENRAGTAVETAKRLEAMNAFEQVMLTDGSDWQADLIAGPAAAVTKGVTLLTWGETLAPETAAFMRSHATKPVTAIGAKAAKTGLAKVTLTATDPSELSMQVIATFFPNPKAVGFATSADFADALTGGAHMAGLQGPLVLIGDTNPPSVVTWVKDTKSLTRLVIYGGTLRISAAQEADLRTALKH